MSKLTFGKGLGDVYILIILVLSALLFALFGPIWHKHYTLQAQILTFCIFGFLFIFFLYLASIGRGAENLWNGRLFSS